MFLNYLFIGFFVLALLAGIVSAISFGDTEVFQRIITATFEQSNNAVQISIALIGVLCFWMGIIKIAEKSGLMERLAQGISPLLGALFPSIPKGHPAMSAIFMNLSANILGLDNAATPIGLQAMQQLETLNPKKGTATDAMIMFIALNASGLTLIPSSIMAFRMQAGAANPTDVFIPILLATLASTMVAVSLVALRQGISLFQRPLLLLFTFIALIIGGVFALHYFLPAATFSIGTTITVSLLLLLLIIGIMLYGLKKKVNVYDAFVTGAKGGFSTAVKIIPYLLAMLVGIGVFRASGAMDVLIEGVRYIVTSIGIKADWVEALPTMLMKPLSGSGARALMVDTMQTYGADSLVGRLASIVQGSTETTLHVATIYFGSIGIKRIRYAIGYSLLADFAGCLAAIGITYLFFAI